MLKICFSKNMCEIRVPYTILSVIIKSILLYYEYY